MKNLSLVILSILTSSLAFGWGELGHNIIGRNAARLFNRHPLFATQPEKSGTFSGRYVQQGHLANIPDINWKNLDENLDEDGTLLGNNAHFLDPENYLSLQPGADFFKTPVPLDYQTAKEALSLNYPGHRFYFDFGSSPWRANQFAQLFTWSLQNYPPGACATLNSLPNHPTRAALAYAGILSHFTGDAIQPFHVSTDYDGQATGQKGLHSYFESDMVDALENEGLTEAVYNTALAMLTAPDSDPDSVPGLRKRMAQVFPQATPDQDVTALVFVESANSNAYTSEVRRLDLTYGIATFEEAEQMPNCQTIPSYVALKAQFDKETDPAVRTSLLKTKILSGTKSPLAPGDVACRRTPSTLVNSSGDLDPKGLPVAVWHKDFIVKRLALGAAVTADIWARKFIQGGRPNLCWTWKYALKPSFVSPTDPKCFGYALKEDPKDFLKKDGTSALPWKKSAATTADCMTF